jgi:hypothetical protein
MIHMMPLHMITVLQFPRESTQLTRFGAAVLFCLRDRNARAESTQLTRFGAAVLFCLRDRNASSAGLDNNQKQAPRIA